MATYYVGAGGNDGSAGTSWATRWLTGAKVIATEAAGDTTYWGPNTWRELMTITASGTAGNPITWIGDYDGSHTDGVGGVVRITGAADELTTGTRANCITANAKNYRTFRGFLLDGASSHCVNLSAAGTDWIIDQCVIMASAAAAGVFVDGSAQLRHTISNCAFVPVASTAATDGLYFNHSADVSDAAHVVKSCLFLGHRRHALRVQNIGGTTVSNCTFWGNAAGYACAASPAVAQVTTINNCIFACNNVGAQAVATSDQTVNYCTFHGNSTARSNVTAGANDVAYPVGFDMRPYLEAFGGGTLVLPLASLASYSGLVEYSAGTGAPSTDWRGHAVAGSLREWGVEEYVSGYGIEAGAGGVTMWPLSQSFIQAIIGG